VKSELYHKRLLREGRDNIYAWLDALKGSLDGMEGSHSIILGKLIELEKTGLTLIQAQIVTEIKDILQDQGLDERYELWRQIKASRKSIVDFGAKKTLEMLPSGVIQLKDKNGSVQESHPIDSDKWEELAKVFWTYGINQG
jgi:hypothetical protein